MKKIKQILRILLSSLDYYFFKFLALFIQKDSPKNKKVLGILQMDVIGDYILFTETLSKYRTLYPADKWEIILIGDSSWTSLIQLFVGPDGWCDKFIPIAASSLRDFKKRIKLFLDLKKLSFDVVVNPNVARTLDMDTIINHLNSSEKIGFEGETLGTVSSKNRDKFYSKLFTAPPSDFHELEIYKSFFLKLGGDVEQLNGTKISYTADDEKAVDQMTSSGTYVAVSPYSSNLLKDWPSEQLNTLLLWIVETFGITVYLTGGAAQKAQIEGDFAVALKNEKIKNIAGALTLRQMACLIKKSCLTISNDSMAAHMAVSLGANLICFLSGLHYGRFFPYKNTKENQKILSVNWDCFGCNWNCIYPIEDKRPVKCIEGIGLEDVKREIKTLLNRN